MLDHHYGTRTLTKREHEVIALVAEGLKNKDVAEALGTTEPVIKNYLRRIYDKLGVWCRVELALWYEARRHDEIKARAEAQGHPALLAAAVPSAVSATTDNLTPKPISPPHPLGQSAIPGK